MLDRPLPADLLGIVMDQLGKVLPRDAASRAQFAHSGGLAIVQRLGEAAPGSPLADALQVAPLLASSAGLKFIQSAPPQDCICTLLRWECHGGRCFRNMQERFGNL